MAPIYHPIIRGGKDGKQESETLVMDLKIDTHRSKLPYVPTIESKASVDHYIAVVSINGYQWYISPRCYVPPSYNLRNVLRMLSIPMTLDRSKSFGRENLLKESINVHGANVNKVLLPLVPWTLPEVIVPKDHSPRCHPRSNGCHTYVPKTTDMISA